MPGAMLGSAVRLMESRLQGSALQQSEPVQQWRSGQCLLNTCRVYQFTPDSQAKGASCKAELRW
jgi:hypothetical protein